MRRYRDRRDAGDVLARHLKEFVGRDGVLVLALPRGGVSVAVPVARKLAAPLGVILVRKLGLPRRTELAMGALARLGQRTEVMRNESVIRSANVSPATFEMVRMRESAELDRQAQKYPLPLVDAGGRVVIVIDDGLATGSTMLAAVRAVREQQPKEVVVAVPVGAPQALDELTELAYTVVCPLRPEPFFAVGEAYLDFAQVSDAEVMRLLDGSTRP